MGAVTLGNSSAASSTALVVTISEMETDTLENTSETKFMDLAYITLLMATVMRDHGTKDESKDMARIHSEVVMQSVVNGTLAILGRLSPR